MRKLTLLLLTVSIIAFSCSKDSEKEKSITVANTAKTSDSTQNNLIVFFIPGLNTEVFSILNQDQNGQVIKRFNTTGFYAPKSYFQNYSDINSNLSALMSGKTTLLGHLGILIIYKIERLINITKRTTISLIYVIS